MKTTIFFISLVLLPLFGASQTSSETISKNLSVEGDWCSGSYLLTADFGKKEGVWQWSKDGVVLEGEVTENINLANYGYGKYSVTYKLSNNKTVYSDEYEFKTLPGPKAEFSYDYLYAAGAMRFKNNTTGNTADFKWSWNFGDGNSSTEMSPVHLYKVEGTYTVTLTVTDANGCSNTMTVEVIWKFPR